MCDIKKYFSCSMSARSNSCLMSLQDIPLHKSRSLAQLIFNNGSEVTLVSSIFAKKNHLPQEEASYTLAGIGSSPTSYSNGRIYRIPLLDSNKEITYIKAFSVESILSDKIGREAVKFNKKNFPFIPKETLHEAGKPLVKKNLIGNTDLALQPACET